MDSKLVISVHFLTKSVAFLYNEIFFYHIKCFTEKFIFYSTKSRKNQNLQGPVRFVIERAPNFSGDEWESVEDLFAPLLPKTFVGSPPPLKKFCEEKSLMAYSCFIKN